MPIKKYRASGIPVYMLNKKAKKSKSNQSTVSTTIPKSITRANHNQLLLHPNFANELLLVLAKYLQERTATVPDQNLFTTRSIALTPGISANLSSQIIKEKEDEEDNTLDGFSVNKDDTFIDGLSVNKDNTIDGLPVNKDSTIASLPVDNNSIPDSLPVSKSNRLDCLCDDDKIIILTCSKNGLSNLIEKELSKATDDNNTKSIDSKQSSPKIKTRQSITRIPVRQNSLKNVPVCKYDLDNERSYTSRYSNSVTSVSTKSAKLKRHNSENSFRYTRNVNHRLDTCVRLGNASPPRPSFVKDSDPESSEVSPCSPGDSTRRPSSPGDSTRRSTRGQIPTAKKPPCGRNAMNTCSDATDETKTYHRTSSRPSKRSIKTPKECKVKPITYSKHKVFYDMRDFVDMEDNNGRVVSRKTPINKAPCVRKGTKVINSLNRNYEDSLTSSSKSKREKRNIFFHHPPSSTTSRSSRSSSWSSDTSSYDSCTSISECFKFKPKRTKVNSTRNHKQYQNLVSHLRNNFQFKNQTRKNTTNNIRRDQLVVENNDVFLSQTNVFNHQRTLDNDRNHERRSLSSTASTTSEITQQGCTFFRNKSSNLKSSIVDHCSNRKLRTNLSSLSSGNTLSITSQYGINSPEIHDRTSVNQSIDRDGTSQISSSSSGTEVSVSGTMRHNEQTSDSEDHQDNPQDDVKESGHIAKVLRNNETVLFLLSIWPDVRRTTILVCLLFAVYGVLVGVITNFKKNII